MMTRKQELVFSQARQLVGEASKQIQDIPRNADVAELADLAADEFRQAAEMLEEMARNAREKE